MSKYDVVIVKTDPVTGTYYFWKGTQGGRPARWTIEYPDATLYSAKHGEREAQRIANYEGRQVRTVRDYGKDEQYVMARCNPTLDGVEQAELAAAAEKANKELQAKRDAEQRIINARILARENAEADVRRAEKVVVEAALRCGDWRAAPGRMHLADTLNEAVRKLAVAKLDLHTVVSS